MKRMMMATLVLCMAAALRMMGQTTATPTTHPTAKPTTQQTTQSTTKPTTNTTSLSAPKEREHQVTEHRVDSLAEFAAKERERKRAEQRMNSASQSAANGQRSGAALKCTGPERRPCTEMMVRDLARRMGEKSVEHPALAKINTLRLESSDGTLSCRQNDGNRCTAEQVRSLNEHVAAEMRCLLRFQYPRANAENATDTKPTPSSDIAAKVAAWESTLDTTNTTSGSAANGQALEGTSNATNTTSDSAAKERERERIERENLLSDRAAREREGIERRKLLAESAAKKGEQEKTERKNSSSVSAANKQREPEKTERKMTSPSKPAKAPSPGKDR